MRRSLSVASTVAEIGLFFLAVLVMAIGLMGLR